MKTIVVYQAGYYSNNEWIICGYGDSPEAAKRDLMKKINSDKRGVEHSIFLMYPYKETIYVENVLEAT